MNPRQECLALEIDNNSRLARNVSCLGALSGKSDLAVLNDQCLDVRGLITRHREYITAKIQCGIGPCR